MCLADEVVVACDVGSELFERLSVFEGAGLLSSLFVDFVKGVVFNIIVDHLAEPAHNNFIYNSTPKNHEMAMR